MGFTIVVVIACLSIAAAVVAVVLNRSRLNSEAYQVKFEMALDRFNEQYIGNVTFAIAVSDAECSFARLPPSQEPCEGVVRAIEIAQPSLNASIDDFDDLIRHPDPEIGPAFSLIVELRDVMERFRVADELIIEGWEENDNGAWISGWGERQAASADLLAIG